MAIITTNSAHELDTQLGRIELENTTAKLFLIADQATRKGVPHLAAIAQDLANEIYEKLEQMQALISEKIKSEQAEIAAENED